ncbi:hypothetical protein [Paenibacillus ginsengihumi]|uniref:hypothetical protein n=1 Tax=Paenibacillus ginsengihumi TaxID=431596 RepID=UPI0012EB6E22|nr:hypothetical protein [Paenibacillus ginsengihumi]
MIVQSPFLIQAHRSCFLKAGTAVFYCRPFFHIECPAAKSSQRLTPGVSPHSGQDAKNGIPEGIPFFSVGGVLGLFLLSTYILPLQRHSPAMPIIAGE